MTNMSPLVKTMIASRDATKAVVEYRTARDRYVAASDEADVAFRRWFERRNAGIPTNGAAAARKANWANQLSAALYSAEGELWKHGIDPEQVDRDDGVAR